MLSKETKINLVGKFRVHDKDSGSSQVQIALLTERISQISEHLKKFPKDYHSQRGLLGLVGQRRSLMNYLAKKDRSAYEKLMQAINA
ncbi:MAG: 30S ribosomal protein S15 [candidate division TM6 bacterium GW2011_GWF2_37_49]|nr:MAG: 30S ribosomal protein S15 [candidate division TM6 bacterium GW2011_GWF2_37_49]